MTCTIFAPFYKFQTFVQTRFLDTPQKRIPARIATLGTAIATGIVASPTALTAGKAVVTFGQRCLHNGLTVCVRPSHSWTDYVGPLGTSAKLIVAAAAIVWLAKKTLPVVSDVRQWYAPKQKPQ